MGAREADERLEKIKASGKTIYSISRIDCINRCLAEAFETYINGNRGNGNIYAIAGSATHQVLEDIVNGKATEADLLPTVQRELDDAEMLGYEFPKMSDGSDGIRQKWITDMTHFCTTYKSPDPTNLTTEELFIYETPDGNIFQGYIDLQRRNADGTINIYDYKTSSLYTGSDVKEHGRQLCVYKMGLEQAGEKVKSVAWIFLKYAEIKFMGKKTVKSKEKTQLSKVVERCKIGSEMAKYVEYDLSELGYDEIDIEILLNEFKDTNKFDCLPEEVRNNYKLLPYVCEYEVTKEVEDECNEYIDSTIKKWEALGTEEDNFPPKSFIKVQKNGKEVSDTFYCSQLCSHSKTCKYYRDYLDQLTLANTEDEDDIF